MLASGMIVCMFMHFGNQAVMSYQTSYSTSMHHAIPSSTSSSLNPSPSFQPVLRSYKYVQIVHLSVYRTGRASKVVIHTLETEVENAYKLVKY